MSATHIPCYFAPARLAISESDLHELLGLNDGRSDRAKKDAVYVFCNKHEIKRIPGGNFPLRQIERALEKYGPT